MHLDSSDGLLKVCLQTVAINITTNYPTQKLKNVHVISAASPVIWLKLHIYFSDEPVFQFCAIKFTWMNDTTVSDTQWGTKLNQLNMLPHSLINFYMSWFLFTRKQLSHVRKQCQRFKHLRIFTATTSEWTWRSFKVISYRPFHIKSWSNYFLRIIIIIWNMFYRYVTDLYCTNVLI